MAIATHHFIHSTNNSSHHCVELGSMNDDGRTTDLREGISATTSSSTNEQKFTINIIIPPKPRGMNSDSRPSSPMDGVESTSMYEYAEGPSRVCAFQVMATPQAAPKGKCKAGVASKSDGKEGSHCLTNQDELAGAKLPFIWKLWEMLEEVERNSQEDIVSWVDGGRAFKVHKMGDFVNHIVPKYFKMSKYKSFQRQLYFYEFQRVNSGLNSGAYRHPDFRKGAKAACLTMVPKKSTRRSTAAAKKQRSKSMVYTTTTTATPFASSAIESSSVERAESLPTFGTGRLDERESFGWPQVPVNTGLRSHPQQDTDSARRLSWPLYDESRNHNPSVEAIAFEERSFHFVDVDFDDLNPRSAPVPSVMNEEDHVLEGDDSSSVQHYEV